MINNLLSKETWLECKKIKTVISQVQSYPTPQLYEKYHKWLCKHLTKIKNK